MAYNPSDWKRDLGQHLYRRYVKIIVDLITIWKATFCEMHNVLYSRYMQIRDTLFERLTEEYTNEIERPINRYKIPNTPKPS